MLVKKSLKKYKNEPNIFPKAKNNIIYPKPLWSFKRLEKTAVTLSASASAVARQPT